MNKGPRNKNKERHVVLNKILCYMLIKIAIPSFLRLKMGTSFKIENDLQPYMSIRKNGCLHLGSIIYLTVGKSVAELWGTALI